MSYQAPETLTEQIVKDSQEKGVAVKNSRGQVYGVRLEGRQPGYLVRSEESLAVVYVLTLAEVWGFCRSCS